MLGGITPNPRTKGVARRRVEEIVRERLKVVAPKKSVVVADADTLRRYIYGRFGEVVHVQSKLGRRSDWLQFWIC
jgi:hypothetical protein